MADFELTQRLMSVRTQYDVKAAGGEGVAMTIVGNLLSASPSFVLHEGDADGRELATLRGNFAKTRFQVLERGEERASVEFPAIAVRKTLSMRVGSKEYTADGGVFKGVFKCADPQGNVALEIAKEAGLRDRFRVSIRDAGIATNVALLAAVAIHSRFFELV